jgi:hypothetical protein
VPAAAAHGRLGVVLQRETGAPLAGAGAVTAHLLQEPAAMRPTLIAVFDRQGAARQAAAALQNRGIDPDCIQVTECGPEAAGAPPAEPGQDERGWIDSARHFLADLFGRDDEGFEARAGLLRPGGAVVKVELEADEQLELARQALEDAGALDIDERIVPRRSGRADPEAEGTPRRHPVEDDPGGDGHVVVFCSVDDDSDFRVHFTEHYAALGARYEDYEPAYRFGSALRTDTRHAGRTWDEVEHDVRVDWSARHPGCAWERFKAAVRRGRDHATD